MSGRTMVKLSVTDTFICLKTVSRLSGASERFYLFREDLNELERKRKMEVSDICSFAKFVLYETENGLDILEITFTWLRIDGAGKVSGRVETIRLLYEKFQKAVEEMQYDPGKYKCILCMKNFCMPKIEFVSRKNLKAVVEKKILRRKLSKFLKTHFLWDGSQRVVIYDDWEPYSFFFESKGKDGPGICGGIILHRQNDLEEAYYEMHT